MQVAIKNGLNINLVSSFYLNKFLIIAIKNSPKDFIYILTL